MSFKMSLTLDSARRKVLAVWFLGLIRFTVSRNSVTSSIISGDKPSVRAVLDFEPESGIDGFSCSSFAVLESADVTMSSVLAAFCPCTIESQ